MSTKNSQFLEKEVRKKTNISRKKLFISKLNFCHWLKTITKQFIKKCYYIIFNLKM